MSKLSRALAGAIAGHRWYGVQARAVNLLQVPAAVPRTDGVGATAADGGSGRAAKKEVFWMRDPKTGCWLPENRFDDEVDAVELRKRLLRYK